MKKLLWLDLEMSGLDVQKDVILEVAAIITNLNFETQEEFHRVVYQPQSVLDRMDEWCQKTHGESGLTQAVAHGKPLEEVEEELCQALDRHYKSHEKIILAGNSIGNDRLFIDQYMKKLSKKLHYRVVDVSSFKEIYKEKFKVEFKKKNTHRATDDIYESIAELKAYLEYVTVPEDGAILGEGAQEAAAKADHE